MSDQADRVTRFKAEVSQLGLRDPVTRREQALLRLGAVGLVAGPIIAIVGYFMSHGTVNTLQQNDALVIAVFGLTVAVAGGAVFLRYSFGRMLRFWLARFAFEQNERATQPASPSDRDLARPLKAR